MLLLLLRVLLVLLVSTLSDTTELEPTQFVPYL